MLTNYLKSSPKQAELTKKTENVYLGRQPILNANLSIMGQELMFRSKESIITKTEDDLTATCTVIVNALSEFGLDYLVSNGQAYISMTVGLLMNNIIELLPRDRVVIELVRDMAINDAVLDRIDALTKVGFVIAISDVERIDDPKKILPHFSIIKIDASGHTMESTKEIFSLCRKHNPTALMLIDNVETEDQFYTYMSMGFNLFQGFFFAKPSTLSSKKVPPSKTVLMRIMGMLLDTPDIMSLENEFKRSPELTVSLLKLVNSVGMNEGRGKVQSLRQALIVLGQQQLSRWIQLLIYSSVETKGSTSIMLHVSNRARLMELICIRAGDHISVTGDQAFMVGMLSLVDSVISMTLPEILNEIGVSQDIKDAVMFRNGELGQLLYLSEQIELGEFESVDAIISSLGISIAELSEMQIESMLWSEEASKSAM